MDILKYKKYLHIFVIIIVGCNNEASNRAKPIADSKPSKPQKTIEINLDSAVNANRKNILFMDFYYGMSSDLCQRQVQKETNEKRLFKEHYPNSAINSWTQN